MCDIIGRQLRTCFLHIHSLSFSILSLDRTVSGFISPTPQLPVGRTCQQQPLCVLFRCFLCYSGRLKFHFFRFMGSCWIPIFSKKLCFVFRLAYPKHLPEVKTCLAHGSQEVPEEDLDTTLPQPGHGFRGSVKTWRGWMRNVRNREHAGKAIAVSFIFQHIISQYAYTWLLAGCTFFCLFGDKYVFNFSGGNFRSTTFLPSWHFVPIRTILRYVELRKYFNDHDLRL